GRRWRRPALSCAAMPQFAHESQSTSKRGVAVHLASGPGIIPAPATVSTRGEAWVEVDVEALVDNARTVAKIAGTRLLPVVKANAYGVGAVLVSKALEQLDPWGYGVATVEEGAELRAAGITRPVLVFMPARARLFDEYERHDLTPALGDAGSVLEWAARGERTFHVEIDTGMGRAGVRWDERREGADGAARAPTGKRELQRGLAGAPGHGDRDAGDRVRRRHPPRRRGEGPRPGAAAWQALSHRRCRPDGHDAGGHRGGRRATGGRR